jgi:hypothetical protein
MIHEDDNTTDLEVQEEATWFEDEFNYESWHLAKKVRNLDEWKKQ